MSKSGNVEAVQVLKYDICLDVEVWGSDWRICTDNCSASI